MHVSRSFDGKSISCENSALNIKMMADSCSATITSAAQMSGNLYEAQNNLNVAISEYALATAGPLKQGYSREINAWAESTAVLGAYCSTATLRNPVDPACTPPM